ncbi:MAG TPA: hypothetical protein VHV47_09555, partial [Opitutaceae bacterium]|nr:hypothetical protein [Opitutaceae bacterium]
MNARIPWLILAKDLRRFRFLVLAAAALTAFLAWFPLHPSLSAGGLDPIDLAAGLRLILVAALGVAITRDDPAIGAEGAWFSRPIGRGQMIGAKLLFIGVFLAAPAALAGAAVAIALSSGARDIALAALAAGMPTLLAAAAGALLGSLTRSYLRTLLAASAVLVAAVFGQHYWEALVNLLTAPQSLGFGQFPPEGGPGHKYQWVVTGSAAACVAVLIFQFLRRRTGQSAALIAGLFALTDVAGTGWPWTAWHNQFRPVRSQPPPVQVAPTDGELSVERVDAGWFPRSDSVRLSLPVRQEAGAAAGLSWWGQSRFAADDGRTYLMPDTEGISNEWIGILAGR